MRFYVIVVKVPGPPKGRLRVLYSNLPPLHERELLLASLSMSLQHSRFLLPHVANPFPPYSLQKRPRPQICPKFVPAIVLGVSSQGDGNLEKFVKICPKITVFQILTIFSKISVPVTGTPQNNRWDKFWTDLGFRAFLRL